MLFRSPSGINTAETPRENITAFKGARSPNILGKIGIIKKRFNGHKPAVIPNTMDETIDSNIN